METGNVNSGMVGWDRKKSSSVNDPDGLQLELVENTVIGDIPARSGGGIPENAAQK